MVLTNLRDHWQGDVRKISMDLVWEDNPIPRQTLYFAAKGETAERLNSNANGFALATLPLAANWRERRFLVESKLCSRLGPGLRFLNEVFKQWYPPISLLTIEAADGFEPTSPPATRRVGCLLSGGIDGLTALRVNRLTYPLDHPESIRDCITLFGINKFDIDVTGPVRERLQAFAALIRRLSALAKAEHFHLHPVHTNVRSLAPGYTYWNRMGFGVGHSAVAQLFQGYLDKVLLASDGDGPNPSPGAMHPLIDGRFSTDAVRIQGVQDEMLRPDKIALLADWEWGRQLMQPCHYITIPENGRINCGRCEKCIRTMLTLIGLGRMPEVTAFQDKQVPITRLFSFPLASRRKVALLMQSLPLLKGAGRFDLVWAIRVRIALYKLFRH